MTFINQTDYVKKIIVLIRTKPFFIKFIIHDVINVIFNI